jgi:DNA (cytosine-5)-methyltransferase 1
MASFGEYVNDGTASTIKMRDYKDATDLVAQPITFGAQMSAPQTDVDMVQTLQAKNPMAVAQPVAFRETADCLTSAYGTKWNGNASADNGSLFAAQPVALGTDCYNGAITGEVAATIGTPGSSVNASGPTVMQPVAPALTASNDPSRSPQSSEVTQQVTAVHSVTMQVRRLTPVECERLQGFPDGYTNIPWRKKPEAPDGPRYKALGNSMAVPCMKWIGQRIAEVDRGD